MEIQKIIAFSGLINFIVSFVFGLIIFKNNPKRRANKALFFLTSSAAIWSFGYWRWLLVFDDYQEALFWLRVLSVGSLFISLAHLQWVLALLEINKKRITFLSYLATFLILPFSFSKLFIVSAEPKSFFSFWPNPGILYDIFLFFIFIPIYLYSISLLVRHLVGSEGVRRKQLLLITIGAFIAVIGGSTNFTLWYNIPINPWGNFLISIYIILCVYAIARHRFLDIKFVLRRSTVYFLSISLVTSMVLLFSYITEGYFLNNNLLYLVDTFIIVVVMLSFAPIKNFFYKVANQYFFTSLYDSQEVLDRVALILRENIDKEKIYNSLMEALDGAFHFNQFGILLFNKRKNKYIVDFVHDFDVDAKAEFESVSKIEEDFVQISEPIVADELKRFYEDCGEDEKCRLDDFLNLLVRHQVAVLCPLRSKGETVGLMVLGGKESGESYNVEDIRLLKNISAQLAITLENAQLYDRLKKFNQQLERRVKLRTKQLNKANEELEAVNEKLHKSNAKLRKLDKAKTEFLSIASHQLRTPLSSTKGFLSLLLDGTYGKIPSKSKRALEKIYISNERLITLVEDLLNISRIEAGHLTFNFKKESLEELAQEVFESMTLAAKNAGLVFEKNFPDKPLPAIYFDRSKVREVISNFIDNAIKYTKEGKVSVIIEETRSKVRLIVQDTGMGIGKDDLEGIFEKFRRGERGGRVNSDGAGLGLYVCRKILDAHEGRVWAESKGLGRGSRFIIEFNKNWKPEKRG
ncbi:MAG TPA: hypothetical protein GX706_02260 [Candidatus Moranbacteria bacterium]|nr:hypothetical protein [Candidatus Moranbacteria bacterium]